MKINKKVVIATAVVVTALLLVAFKSWVDNNYDCTKQHHSKWCQAFIYPTKEEN